MLRELVGSDELAQVTARIAGEISTALGEGVVLIGILKGSVPFLADLARAMEVQTEIDFLALSSYGPDSGRVRIVKDLEGDIHGRDVVIVEDIVDTGLTLNYVVAELLVRGPRSLSVCTLLDRAARRLVATPLHWVGFAIEEDFALGYGLDYQGRYRNLDRIVAGDLNVLLADPDAYLGALYEQ